MSKLPFPPPDEPQGLADLPGQQMLFEGVDRYCLNLNCRTQLRSQRSLKTGTCDACRKEANAKRRKRKR